MKEQTPPSSLRLALIDVLQRCLSLVFIYRFRLLKAQSGVTKGRGYGSGTRDGSVCDQAAGYRPALFCSQKIVQAETLII
jgi:hypothetical protein